MRRLHFHPIAGRAREILDAILLAPEVASCKDKKEVFTLRLVCEELVVNVVNYAYTDDTEGWLDVEIERESDSITIRFIDGGTPFNPLEREMPDTKKPLQERQVGGLGIFLIIRKMDEVTYDYVDDLTLLCLKIND